MEEWISGVAQATAGRLSNIANTSVVGVRLNLAGDTGSILTPGEAYKTLIDAASAQLASGKGGLHSAVRSVLKQFADSGLQVVDYESGATRSLGAAVEMNLKEATSMVYQGVQDRIGQEYGADGKEISAHGDCAPDHLDIQGRQFTNKEFEKLQNSLRRPIGKMNCRHIYYSIIIGVSEPTYSDAELKAMKQASLRKVEFDGKEMTAYEASQAQRKLEREIRKQKNRSVIAKEAGDDEMRREAQMKINQLTGKYKDLSDTFGLQTKAQRMQVSGFRPIKTITPIKKTIEKGVKQEPRPFESIKKLHNHFLKHGSDYGFFDDNDENMRLYEKMALVFANKEKTETMEEFFNQNGFFFRYDFSTNEFLTMKPNGIIETYFKPEKGAEYWEIQKKKWKPKETK